MALNGWRWVVAAAIGCLLVGTLASRPRPLPQVEPLPRVLLEQSAREAGRRAALAAERLRLRQLHDSVRSTLAANVPGDSSRWILSAAIPGWTHRSFNALRRRAATARPARVVRPIDVVVVYDTATTVRSVPRSRSDRIETDYVLPATADDRCMVLVRLRLPMDSARRGRVANYLSSGDVASRLTGPCGFYEWFGNPGPGVDRWLRGGAWAFGHANGHWDRSVTPVDFRGFWRSYGQMLGGIEGGWPLRDFVSPRGYRCLSGDEATCEQVLLGAWVPPARQQVWDSGFVSPGRLDAWLWWRQRYELGPAESRVLASFVHRLGPEKFQQFWRSSQPVDQAFLASAGVPIGDAVSEWAEQVYGPSRRGPGVRGTALAGSVVLGIIALGLAAAAARRRRVV